MEISRKQLADIISAAVMCASNTSNASTTAAEEDAADYIRKTVLDATGDAVLANHARDCILSTAENSI